MTRLFRYRCVNCEHQFFLDDDGEDSPICCPYCASTEIWSDGEIQREDR